MVRGGELKGFLRFFAGPAGVVGVGNGRVFAHILIGLWFSDRDRSCGLLINWCEGGKGKPKAQGLRKRCRLTEMGYFQAEIHAPRWNSVGSWWKYRSFQVRFRALSVAVWYAAGRSWSCFRRQRRGRRLTETGACDGIRSGQFEPSVYVLG